MSYSIVFETKVVRLPDGRVIHFDRSGCNNDNTGRQKDDFRAEIYTEAQFIVKANRLRQNSKPYKAGEESWDLKIGNRFATYYDYGEHLLRMLKRALSYEDFIKSYFFSAHYCEGIQLLKPERRMMTVAEFDDPVEILNYLKQGKDMSFCIIKR